MRSFVDFIILQYKRCRHSFTTIAAFSKGKVMHVYAAREAISSLLADYDRRPRIMLNKFQKRTSPCYYINLEFASHILLPFAMVTLKMRETNQ